MIDTILDDQSTGRTLYKTVLCQDEYGVNFFYPRRSYTWIGTVMRFNLNDRYYL